MMQNAFRRVAPRFIAGAGVTALFTTKAFASEAPAVCPVNHGAIPQQTTPPAGVCPVDHKALAAQNPGVCPIDHKAYFEQQQQQQQVCPVNHKAPEMPEALKKYEEEQKTGVCPVNHGEMKKDGVCPVNHGEMKKEGVCPVNHGEMKKEGVCPVNHGEMKKEGVCPVNHGVAKKEEEAKTGVCPVNHGEMKKEGACPVNHTNIPIAISEEALKEAEESGVCPMNANPMAAMGSHMGGLQGFVGKSYAGSKEPRNDSGDRLANSDAHFFHGDFHGGYDPSKVEYADFVPGTAIPAAGRGNSVDGAHWVNPTPMQLFRAIRRKEMDLKEEDALAVAFTHADVVDFTWQLIQEYEEKYKAQCPNPALKRFEGKYGFHTPKSWAMDKMYGITPYDRHDWWIDRCGTEVRYIIDYYSNSEDEYWMDVRPDMSTTQNVVDRIEFAYDKYKKGEKWF